MFILNQSRTLSSTLQTHAREYPSVVFHWRARGVYRAQRSSNEPYSTCHRARAMNVQQWRLAGVWHATLSE